MKTFCHSLASCWVSQMLAPRTGLHPSMQTDAVALSRWVWAAHAAQMSAQTVERGLLHLVLPTGVRSPGRGVIMQGYAVAMMLRWIRAWALQVALSTARIMRVNFF